MIDTALAIEKLVPSAEYFGVPKDQSSYEAIRWLDERKKPTWAELEAAMPDPLEEQQAALQKEFTDAVQLRLDTFAKTRRYDDIGSAIGKYANSHVPKYKAESDYCAWALSETWITCEGIMNDVLLGIRPVPSLSELMAELPALVWPDMVVEAEQ